MVSGMICEPGEQALLENQFGGYVRCISTHHLLFLALDKIHNLLFKIQDLLCNIQECNYCPAVLKTIRNDTGLLQYNSDTDVDSGSSEIWHG